ncbi:hypothetical protein [Streptomyces sp. DASNCL29]|uniref:hypothetical protein n=1 Tax=Streptomyces sp. DASNCL29 TaxID=2583819 RepID=UPI00110FB4F0|nr:hypothetical protein [Streptomyces sp. DASNCL29]TMU97573.1 hypothetical protein FGK60_06640 [Streptomyces sp. DASNCL29]
MPAPAVGPPVPDFGQVAGGRADFSARRFTHETAVHRADAVLALGGEYTLDQEVALDGFDEWLAPGPRRGRGDPGR